MNLTPEQEERLTALALSANERLETAGKSNASQAFNLGCFLGLVPTLLFTIIMYFISGKSWIGAAIMTIFSLLVVIAVANFLALKSRQNTLDRFYQTSIEPELCVNLTEENITMQVFAEIADETLPGQAALLKYIHKIP